LTEVFVLKTKLSKYIVPLSDLRVNPDEAVSIADNDNDKDKAKQEVGFVKAIVQGLVEIQAGNTIDIGEVKKQLGL